MSRFSIIAACLATLLASQALADESALPEGDAQSSETSHVEPGVTADLQITVKRPLLDENGVETVDQDGNPVHEYVALTETQVLPGDELKYRINIDNGGKTAENLAFMLNVPEGIEVIGETISSTVEATFMASPRNDAEKTIEIFADPDTRQVSEDFDETAAEVGALHIAIDKLDDGASAVVIYHATVK